MNLVGLMPVRNESWCLALTARAALLWLDHLVICLHCCTDQSLEILLDISREHPGRISWFTSGDPQWSEMEQRQELLEYARALAATHIAIVDADEILTGNLLPTIRPLIEARPAGQMLMLPGYNVRGGIAKYHISGVWGNRWFSTAFKDIDRLSWKGDKHHSREPEGIRWEHPKPVAQGAGGIMHLWGAAERRLIAKHALYKVRDTLRWPDKLAEHDRSYSWAIKGDTRPPYAHFGTPATWTYADVPASWWEPYEAWLKHLDLEQEPWQESHTRALVAEHGRERFTGLDLFGVT